MKHGPALAVALLLAGPACLAACPADPSVPAETLLSLHLSTQAPIRLDRRALAALGEQQLTQRPSHLRAVGALTPCAAAACGTLRPSCVMS